MRDSWEERDRERREYEGDVYYEVWSRGGNPDAVYYDCVLDCYYDGREAAACAAEEVTRQRRPPPMHPDDAALLAECEQYEQDRQEQEGGDDA